MSNHKISVIVPVYKVEQYLDRCVKSIVGQTHKNLEIILVDDGSPDNCPQMCDEWAKKDGRIVVVHKTNGGLGDARNSGIDKATGDYLSFIDSDDFITAEYIETLYNMCIKHDSDIAQCGFTRVCNDEIISCTAQSDDVKIYTNVQMLYNLFNEHVFATIVSWGKLYRTRLFEEIRFPNIITGEDEAIIHKIIYKANRIVVSKKRMYMYYHNPDSMTRRNRYGRERLSAIDTFDERIRFFDENGLTELAEKAVTHHCIGIILAYNKSKKYIPDSKDVLTSLMEKYKRFYKRALRQKSLSTPDKIKLVLYRFLPCLPTWLGNKYAT